MVLDFFDFAADFDDDDVAFDDTAIGAGAADVAAALRAAVTAFVGAAGAGDWAEAVSANTPATNAIRSLLI